MAQTHNAIDVLQGTMELHVNNHAMQRFARIHKTLRLVIRMMEVEFDVVFALLESMALEPMLSTIARKYVRMTIALQ